MTNAHMYALQDIVEGIDDVTDYQDGPVFVYGVLGTPRSVRWNKSRGNPDASRYGSSAFSREPSINVSQEGEEPRSGSTPYRLPRLSPRGDNPSSGDSDSAPHEELKTPTGDKVWSRHGYEKIIRIPELSPQIRMLIPPPKPFVQSCRTPNTAPRFKQAAITPSCRSVPWTLSTPVDDSHLQLYKSTSARVHDDDAAMRSGRFEPTPTPISRSNSPAKSVKSIHWILGHNRYHTFDKKGRSHVQGPYSREFNVTCSAPSNWLRMKLGRSKTMIH